MERLKGWLCFNFKNSLFLPIKGLLLKLTSCLTPKAKDSRQGLVILYKDMEACGGYADIQVMWEMIHSSCPSNTHKTKPCNSPPHQRSFLCFSTT